MAVEVELKFRAADARPLRVLATVPRLADAELEPAATVDEIDRYLDTDDGRMAAAGWACRLRTRAAVTRVSLKGLRQAGGERAVHRRPEVEGPAVDDPDAARWPPSAARDLVERLADGNALGERFRLRQRRTERAVRRGGHAIGTLSLDRVEIEADGTRLGTLHAVELELLDSGDGAEDARQLAELTAALARVRGLEVEHRTKLDHALALLGRRR